MKICRSCQVEKPREAFYPNLGARDLLRSTCKLCHCAKTNEWRQQHMDKSRQYGRKYARRISVEKPEQLRAKSQRWRNRNPERSREVVRRSYKKLYYENYLAARARLGTLEKRRRAATPRWLSAIQRAQMREMYDVAKAHECQTGLKHHVDHIYPLNGDNSCGLHVPWNLQVLIAAENISKKNKIADVHQ